MSNFSVDVTTIEALEPIQGADLIELAKIREYRAVVKKGVFAVGDKVAYIPEASLLPPELIEKMGLVGRLAGSEKNRVKAIKLRGQLSQGLVLPADPEWEIGQDVAEVLGITKWEVPIPPHLRGNVVNAMVPYTMTYDVENFKNFPDLIFDDEPVVVTEKIHGTCCIFTLLPEENTFVRSFNPIIAPASYDRETGVLTPAVRGDQITVLVEFYAASKGLSKQGLVFVPEENPDNVYVHAAIRYDIKNRMKSSSLVQSFLKNGPVHILGEVYGPGIQDLGYSKEKNGPPSFRAFDIYVGLRGNGRFLNDDEFEAVLADIQIDRVPVLYKGPFSVQVLKELTDGKETVSGLGLHIREGVVVRPLIERAANDHLSTSKKFDRGKRFDGLFNRVQLKSVSGDYLTRSNSNATEYQ